MTVNKLKVTGTEISLTGIVLDSYFTNKEDYHLPGKYKSINCTVTCYDSECVGGILLQSTKKKKFYTERDCTKRS